MAWRCYGFVDSEFVKRVVQRIYENFIEKEKRGAETRSRDQMSNALEKSSFAKNERKFYICRLSTKYVEQLRARCLPLRACRQLNRSTQSVAKLQINGCCASVSKRNAHFLSTTLQTSKQHAL
ncbi:MAG: hypothetical protein HY22_10780 [[Candidatus Thermochlorobacteriaceae] bacterium GBChlB]|nr:MAG: hypothetical protein HY22_10780 [[Candidatus Thermochlorobacteriaceae] bacterium GBChlB]